MIVLCYNFKESSMVGELYPMLVFESINVKYNTTLEKYHTRTPFHKSDINYRYYLSSNDIFTISKLS